jgi:predicted transcriptional regulator
VRVEEIMTRDVSFCSPGTNAAVATEIMWIRNCGSLPAVDDIVLRTAASPRICSRR